jgi:hypothetical protein
MEWFFRSVPKSFRGVSLGNSSLPHLALLGLLWLTPNQAAARSIFLNGADVSGVRNQSMNDVSVHIDELGNVMISAPQYKVHDRSRYHPINKQKKPAHQADAIFPNARGTVQALPSHPEKGAVAEVNVELPAGEVPQKSLKEETKAKTAKASADPKQ